MGTDYQRSFVVGVGNFCDPRGKTESRLTSAAGTVAPCGRPRFGRDTATSPRKRPQNATALHCYRFRVLRRVHRGHPRSSLRPHLGGLGEAHIPAKCSSEGKEARFPCSYGHSGRASRSEGSARQGPRPSLCLRLAPAISPWDPPRDRFVVAASSAACLRAAPESVAGR